MPILKGAKFDKRGESQKTVVIIEFTTLTLCRVRNEIEAFAILLQNYGLTGDRCQHLQVSVLAGIKNYKKLLSPLNSPPSICEDYKISSKLKHLLFFVQNYGLKEDRCQHWQVSKITGNYCRQWIQQLQIVHYAKLPGKWLTSFPFLKIAQLALINYYMI